MNIWSACPASEKKMKRENINYFAVGLFVLTMLTVFFARFPPRRLGLLLGRPFGKRRGLTFAGTFLVVEALFQFGDALHEFVDLTIAFAAPWAWP